MIFVHASLLQGLKTYWGSQNRFVVGNSYEAFGSLVTWWKTSWTRNSKSSQNLPQTDDINHQTYGFMVALLTLYRDMLNLFSWLIHHLSTHDSQMIWLQKRHGQDRPSHNRPQRRAW